MSEDTTKVEKPAHKTLWFIGLYIGGVIAVASISYALRALA